MAFYDIDPDSLALIVELQRSEIQSLAKGKYKEGTETDNELAIQMYGEQLDMLDQSLSDHRLCHGISRAIDQDRDGGTAHVQNEDQGTRDRQSALSLDHRALNTAVIPKGVTKALSRAILKQVPKPIAANAETLFGWLKTRILSLGQICTAAVAKSSLPAKLERRCVSCGDLVQPSRSVHCPCSHDYCHDCIIELFSAAASDESLFPPRCCKQAIPFALGQEFLPAPLVKEFRLKVVEYATPNRTYCHKLFCSAFIPPLSIAADIGTCLECKSETCTICKGESHKDDCPEDPAMKEVLRLASENGWQRCPSCRRMVELEIGCYHMSEIMSLPLYS